MSTLYRSPETGEPVDAAEWGYDLATCDVWPPWLRGVYDTADQLAASAVTPGAEVPRADVEAAAASYLAWAVW